MSEIHSSGDTVFARIAGGREGDRRLAFRVSGRQSSLLLEKFGSDRTQPFKRGIYPLRLHLPLPGLEKPVMIEAFAAYFPEGGSFTGEESLEIHLPGCPLFSVAFCEQLLSFGLRHASPGEFSRRAFLNGRLSLEEAGAIARLIGAGQDAERKTALRTLSGMEGSAMRELRERFFELRRDLEAAIDFPEEPDLEHGGPDWPDRLEQIGRFLHERLSACSRKPQNCARFKAVLIGAPNVGKSSLIQSLIPSSKPVVSMQEGTTLDLVPHALELPSKTILDLYDAPGITDSDSELDRLSMKQLNERLPSFDIVLYCRAPGFPPVRLSREPDCESLRLLCKCDMPDPVPVKGELPVSAVTGENLPALLLRLDEIQARLPRPAEPWNEVERLLLSKSLESLDRLFDLLQPGCPQEELAAAELEHLMEGIDTRTWKDRDSEEVLDSIFSGFCIGK